MMERCLALSAPPLLLAVPVPESINQQILPFTTPIAILRMPRRSTFRCHGSQFDFEEGVQVRFHGKLYRLQDKTSNPLVADHKIRNQDFIICEPKADQAYAIVEKRIEAIPVIRSRATLQANAAGNLQAIATGNLTVVHGSGRGNRCVLRSRDTGQTFSDRTANDAEFVCLQHKPTDAYVDVISYRGQVYTNGSAIPDSQSRVRQSRKPNGRQPQQKSGCCIQ